MPEPKPNFHTNPTPEKKPENKEGISEKQLENIKEVFKLNPELFNIGTPELYRNYLETIFPESTLKEIVYHHTDKNITTFSLEFSNPKNQWGEGIYFTDKVNLLKTWQNGRDLNHRISVVIESRNPIRDSYISEMYKEYADRYDVDFNKIPFNHSDMLKKLQEIKENKKADSIVLKEQHGGEEYVVFNPEQIHILGSKTDIEQFKNWAEKQHEEK